MRLILFHIFLLIGGSFLAQDIDRNDPTYFEVNFEHNARLINWSGAEELGERLNENSWYYIGFYAEEVSDSAKLYPVQFNTKTIRPKLNKSLKKHTLFYMDTVKDAESRAYRCYPNPIYFDSLYFVDALYIESSSQKVGIVTEKLLSSIKPQDLCSILIRLGVINTYYHLYSELVTTKQIETDDYFEVHYFVQWHICTNECNDPTYEFGMKLDKNTGELFAFYPM